MASQPAQTGGGLWDWAAWLLFPHFGCRHANGCTRDFSRVHEERFTSSSVAGSTRAVVSGKERAAGGPGWLSACPQRARRSWRS